MFYKRYPFVSPFLLALGGVLKIFPIFGIVAFYDSKKPFLRWVVLCMMLVFGGYVLYNLDAFEHISANTPISREVSYGLKSTSELFSVFFEEKMNMYISINQLYVVGLIFVFLFTFILFRYCIKNPIRFMDKDEPQRSLLLSFLVGSSIYIYLLFY